MGYHNCNIPFLIYTNGHNSHPTKISCSKSVLQVFQNPVELPYHWNELLFNGMVLGEFWIMPADINPLNSMTTRTCPLPNCYVFQCHSRKIMVPQFFTTLFFYFFIVLVMNFYFWLNLKDNIASARNDNYQISSERLFLCHPPQQSQPRRQI